jgi:hypothetical protein
MISIFVFKLASRFQMYLASSDFAIPLKTGSRSTTSGRTLMVTSGTNVFKISCWAEQTDARCFGRSVEFRFRVAFEKRSESSLEGSPKIERHFSALSPSPRMSRIVTLLEDNKNNYKIAKNLKSLVNFSFIKSHQTPSNLVKKLELKTLKTFYHLALETVFWATKDAKSESNSEI